MKRPLVMMAAGFVLGEVLALQLPAETPGLLLLPMAGAVSLFLALAGIGCRRTGLVLLTLAFILAGFGRGWQVRARLDAEERQAAAVCGRLVIGEDGTRGFVEGPYVTAEGTVETVKENAGGGLSITLGTVAVREGEGNVRLGRLLVFLQGEGNLVQPECGRRLRVRGRLERVEKASNPGQFDFAGYYRAQGLVCRMFAEEAEETGGEARPYSRALTRLKLHCRRVLRRCLSEEDAAVLEAILLGDKAAMAPELRELYQKSGISHLLAISGQHLAILGGGLYLALRRLGLRFSAAGLLGAAAMVSYGILTGSSGSAMRAVVMLLCLWLAAACGRTYDSPSALGLAAVLLLWKNPYLLLQSGFQLSFAAVAAIGGLSRWLEAENNQREELKKAPRRLRAAAALLALVRLSLCVQLVITPIILWHYFQYPPYGILLNLLAAPLVAVLLYSGLLVIAAGSLWTAAGVFAGASGHYILAYYGWLCERFAGLPGSSLVFGRPSWGQIVLYAGAAAMLAAGGRRAARAARTAGGKRKENQNGAVLLPGLCLYISLFAALAIGLCLLRARSPQGLEVWCLDVGQGDGIVLQSGGLSALLDGGSSSDKSLGEAVLEPFLKSRGISRLDYAIVSHGDSDHISGLRYLLQDADEIEIGALILPATGRGQEVYQELEQLASVRGARTVYLQEGDVLKLGTLRFTCLYSGGESPSRDDRNAHSLVLCADYGALHLLLTGDIGKSQERELLRLAGTQGQQRRHLAHVNLLKIAHHGSDGSSDEELLRQLPLKAAVVSYGADNTYGHPAPRVVNALEKRGVLLFETAIGGAVRLRADGEEVAISYFAPPPS